jgi:hypothetical protein
LLTTQLGLRRLNGVFDTYLLSTLLPRLYQTNSFARQRDTRKTGEIECELTTADTPAAAQEIQALREEVYDEKALSQAVKTILVTTRAARKRKATSMAKDAAVKKALKMAKADARGGRKM